MAADVTSATDTAQLLSLFLASPPGWDAVDQAAERGITNFAATTPDEHVIDVIARVRRGQPDARGFYFVVSLPELGVGFASLYFLGFVDRGELRVIEPPLPGARSARGLLPPIAGELTGWTTIGDFLAVIDDGKRTALLTERVQRELVLA